MNLHALHNPTVVLTMPANGIKPRSRDSSALDPATVEAARTGDRAAWSTVVARYHTRVVSIFIGYAIAHARATELSQDVWLKLFLRARQGLIEVLSLPGLAIREARYRALDELRGLRRSGPVADLDSVPLEAPEPSAEEQASRKSELHQARRMLRALPKRQKQVMLLAAVRGTPHAEVAAQLGISTVRAKQTLSDARQRLRRIRRMPDPVREAYLLVASDGLSADAAAERMGASRATLHEHLLAAKQLLKNGGAR